jgi:hypothetical protein
MSNGHHSEQPGVIMGGEDTVATYDEEHLDHSAPEKESRDKIISAEMLGLIDQFVNLWATSANHQERLSKPPNAQDRIFRKRISHYPRHIAESSLRRQEPCSPMTCCPRHATGAAAIRRYHRSVSENRHHVSTPAGVIYRSVTWSGRSKRGGQAYGRLRDCCHDVLPTIPEETISPPS